MGRLQVVYQNTMAGALRIRARDGHGLAWATKIVGGNGFEVWCVVSIK